MRLRLGQLAAGMAVGVGAALWAASSNAQEVEGGGGGVAVSFVLKGNIINGRALKHDELTFTVKLPDVVEPVAFNWDDLHTREAKRLRKLLGERLAQARPGGAGGAGSEADGDGELVEVTVIRMKDGKTIVGVEIEDRRTKEAICIRSRGMTAMVVLAETEGITRSQKPAGKYLSPLERYRRRWRARQPKTAKGHFEAAKYCAQIGLPEVGSEHLEKCRILDKRYVPRTEKLMAELKADLLRLKQPGVAGPLARRPSEAELRRLVISRWYTALDGALHDFVRKGVADSVVQVHRIVVKGSREVYQGVIKEQTADEILLWNAATMTEVRIDRKAIRNMTRVATPRKVRAATFAEAKRYVTDPTGGITAEAARRVAKARGIGESQARDIWQGRLKKRIVHREGGGKEVLPRYYSLREANYGAGSWLRPKDPKAGAGAGAGAGPDPEAWWKRCPTEVRVAVLRAFCYEALLDVTRVEKTKCSGCGGAGSTLVIDPVGAGSRRTCGSCLGGAFEYKVICR